MMQTKMRGSAHVVQPFVGSNWNNLDGEPSELPVGALHYTSMPHQPHVPRARARLARSGWKHWFDGAAKPHWNTAVVELFEQMLAEAIEAGHTPESYCADPIYGDYRKRSLAAMNGAVPHWGRS
jgi:hypothetical protein